MDEGNTRFASAMAGIDAANAEDPNLEIVDGTPRPREQVYAERMSRWLDRLVPGASEPLRLAVRAQHIRRWTVPRDAYSPGPAGYKQWRTYLAKYHAATAGEVMRKAGYDEAAIRRVQSLVRKERFKTDPEAQALEDVACLVFLEHYFDEFARRHDSRKLEDIIRKTWRKMSEQGRRAAVSLDLPQHLQDVVDRAVSKS